ncbi:imidazole glycerol phosphate synthase subunit HisH [Abditibacteriota bacterium]|nr:imidazole glycerol phosphate synthase subunit HisH [Abditibacteriota bacterium]
MITILDYSVNNLRSVQKAFEHLGHQTQVTSDADEIARAEKLVLPGVGAFGEAMRNLEAKGLIDPVVAHAQSGKPLMGVCLGMQLLFDWSDELGVYSGLGILGGGVHRFTDAPDLKIPHIGWSGLTFPRESKLYHGLENGEMTYFVHSYHVQPEDPSIVAATAHHGQTFVAGVERENVMGAQFHPEKSSAVGLRILDNFGKL